MTWSPSINVAKLPTRLDVRDGTVLLHSADPLTLATSLPLRFTKNSP